jgi:hypothetical protein
MGFFNVCKYYDKIKYLYIVTFVTILFSIFFVYFSKISHYKIYLQIKHFKH